MSDLIPVEKLTAPEIFNDAEAMQSLIDQVAGLVLPIVPDLSTVTSRKAIATLARKVASTKVVIDDAGKELVAGIKKQSAAIDAQRKLARDKLDALRDQVRQPLTDWEAEEERKAEADRQAAREAFEAEERRRQEDLAEREAELNRRQAELDRKEQEERDRVAAEKAEQQRQEAEQRAADEARRHAEAEAAQRIADAEAAAQRAEDERAAAELAAQQQAELAEQRRIDAARKAEEDKAAAVAEAQRQAELAAQRAEQQRQAEDHRRREDDARRAADVEHRRAINGAALAALIAEGLAEDVAKSAITAIIAGRVPAVTITY